MKSLHDLPKDMLIKIILNVKKQNHKEKVDLLRESYYGKHIYCQYRNCEDFNIMNHKMELIFNTSKNNNILTCYSCRKNFCETHDNMIYFQCCDFYQCKNHTHNSCKTCRSPLCENFECKKKKCKNCNQGS